MSWNSIECICNVGLNFCIYQCHDGRKNAGVWVNQNVEYTVITEKMLGSWLPNCNNLYDIIYQGDCFWKFCVCMCFWDEKVKIVPNTSTSVRTHIGHLCTERCQSYFHCTFGRCKMQVHTDMQNWPSAGPKGLLAVAVCTVLNFC